MGDRHVSIHAPQEGCDYPRKNYRIYLDRFQFTHPGRGATIALIPFACSRISFNSRTPGGVRLQNHTQAYLTSEFQFTHPGRGATRRDPAVYCSRCSFNSRTPGGVRLAVTFSALACKSCFNSRTPGGVRQTLTTCVVSRLTFQFTHPGRGATIFDQNNRGRPPVSIHAPREGCDLMGHNGLKTQILFQFTHPGRGATRLHVSELYCIGFQFTHPGRGATVQLSQYHYLD